MLKTLIPVPCPMRTGDLLEYGRARLEQAGIDQAALEAELLLGFCLEKNRAGLFLGAADEVETQHQETYFTLLSRRAGHEPTAYIMGEKEFWSLPFVVTPDVLIPRPETEFLVETALDVSGKGLKLPDGPVLDLCCGSGVIGIVLARETGRDVVAVDVSLAALRIALKNARRHQVADRFSPVQADLLDAFSPQPFFSLVVTNPPYVSELELRAGLQPEVMRFEPHLALDGGAGGLEVIRRIRKDVSDVLLPGGDFFMEIGADQGPAVLDLFAWSEPGVAIFEQVKLLQDYSGRDRVLHARKATQGKGKQGRWKN